MSSSWAEGLADSGVRWEKSHVSWSHLHRVHAEVCWLPAVELRKSPVSFGLLFHHVERVNHHTSPASITDWSEDSKERGNQT